MEDKLKTLLVAVTKLEEQYYGLAEKALDKGNVFGNQIHAAEASAFQRCRYLIEDLLEE